MISFSSRHYPKFIILQCVRWYVSYSLPYRINVDNRGSNKATLDHFNKPGRITGKRKFTISQPKYLNNIVEQDHRHIKRIIAPMGGMEIMQWGGTHIEGMHVPTEEQIKAFINNGKL